MSQSLCQKCMDKTFSQELLDKYSNTYFRELVILYHIRELELKANKCIAEDRKPFHDPNFLKELADMYILLKLMKYHDSQFRTLIKTRMQKFESKIEKNTETITVTFSRLSLEDKKAFYELCNNLPQNKFHTVQDFLIKIDHLLYQHNKYAVVFIHNGQICISIVDSNAYIVNQAYDLVANKISDIINID